jgi:hypothetical protein
MDFGPIMVHTDTICLKNAALNCHSLSFSIVTECPRINSVVFLVPKDRLISNRFSSKALLTKHEASVRHAYIMGSKSQTRSFFFESNDSVSVKDASSLFRNCDRFKKFNADANKLDNLLQSATLTVVEGFSESKSCSHGIK